jgi:hypothetical protein
VKQQEAEGTSRGSESSKIRNVPHIKGNWATLVYIQIGSEGLETWVQGAIQTLRLKNPQLQGLDDLHISLSRTVYLKEYQIDRFVQRINECFSKTRERFKCRRYQLEFDDGYSPI